MKINHNIVVAVLAVSGAFAVHNTAVAEGVANNSSNQTAVSDAATPMAAFEVSRTNSAKRATRSKSAIDRLADRRDQLSDLELKELLYFVGFRGHNLKEAWCIAKRESNGRPMAHNQNSSTGDNSYGIFQINMIGNLGPDRREKFELDSNSDLFNPIKNAKIAFYMSNGGEDWSSWHGMNAKAKEWLDQYPI